MESRNKINNDEEKLDEEKINRLKKLSAPQISDSLNKLKIKGQIISGISPLKHDMTVCGLAFTAVYVNNNGPEPKLFESNRYMLDEIPRNKQLVIMIENKGTPGLASVWGFLVSLYAKNKGILGTITNSHIRDIKEIQDLHYPVFCTGKSCQNSNEFYKVIALQKSIQLNGVCVNPDDYVLADSSGIAIIPRLMIDKVLLLAEEKQKDENKIVELMNAGLSLREIDEIMNKKTIESSMYSSSTTTLFNQYNRFFGCNRDYTGVLENIPDNSILNAPVEDDGKNILIKQIFN